MSSDSDKLVISTSLNPATNSKRIGRHKYSTAKNQVKEKQNRNEQVDRVNVGMKEVYKSLTVLGNEIVDKLDGLLKNSLPEGGIRALKPENHTPEATASRIADGVLALFPVYQKQNPNLKGEELISSFMSTIRGGVKQGYDDAAGILDGLGAFQFNGVKEGISKTMELVEEKLTAFENTFRESLNKQAENTKPSAGDTVIPPVTPPATST